MICIDREEKRNALDRATLAELVAALQQAGASSEDAAEGRAFFDDREPHWTGR